ncbi:MULTISPECIES: replicative DNA helicase [Ruminococcus]|uniref:Replicative DNA helicase n=1 Tax=Ruminococcus flavefaciens TaxID=1265 RepID=A0A315Y795_RUMFL|nr:MULTISPECIES: replicative DNA helicase [Ruminococcus]MBQ6033959.1 replicative DNA helicase [Ruminococcus sp.]MBQ6251335.1 replicative DNA helicase [Ruminococcus sp.]MBR0512183.1 replicative DNA helicase [Ruminococcus sp.]MBR3668054.1 replicative DNA helicase [Ruminococcus sp.]MBR6995968.1 replicative DNA helicase [Ruminococcus sp.]
MDENDILLSARELPHSIEAEQSVLGAIIADPSVLSDVLELIKPEYFYNDQHKALYSIMLQMNSMSLPVDIVTVLNEAEKQHIFESPAEGRRYLAEIGNMLPSTANIESYCKIVADKYFLRSLSYVARTILEEVQSGEQNAQLLLDSAEQKIYDIRQGRDVRGLVPLSEAIAEAYDRLGKISGPDKDKYVGARTGFTLLDSITSGLNKSDLIIIAARPGMGKTSFAMNIATNVARRAEKEVVTFNLEMSKEQLATRILSTEALVESNTLRNGRISGDDWVKLATSAGYLSSLPLYIDDTASMTVQQMKAKLRRTKNLGLVIIDYLQLMESTSRSDNRVTVISEITRQLKVMAKELNVPVILLSQLSRAVESRTDKRPMLSDLRESGSIEQDADIVLFLYREAYYNKESQRQNISECIVAKNRHGETGTVELIWDGQYTRFSNPDYETPPENV